MKRNGCPAGQIRINGNCVDKSIPNLRPMIGRTGGKTKLKKTLVAHVPPHNVYVEPFVGGGSLYFAKPLVDKNVINDADPALIKFYRDTRIDPYHIQGCNLPVKEKQFLTSKNRIKPNGTYDDPCDYLGMIKRSYGQIGKKYDPKHEQYSKTTKIPPSKRAFSESGKKIEMYNKKLKKTIISNGGFCPVMEKHDSKDTFHYLDPPYHGTSQPYGLKRVNVDEVISCASKMKGKVLVSYDNHPEVRKAFKGWKVEKVETKYELQSSNPNARGVKKDVTELMIMNYNPKTGERINIPKAS